MHDNTCKTDVVEEADVNRGKREEESEKKKGGRGERQTDRQRESGNVRQRARERERGNKRLREREQETWREKEGGREVGRERERESERGDGDNRAEKGYERECVLKKREEEVLCHSIGGKRSKTEKKINQSLKRRPERGEI